MTTTATTTCTQTQLAAIKAMDESNTGAVWIEGRGYVWPQHVRGSDATARQVLDALRPGDPAFTGTWDEVAQIMGRNGWDDEEQFLKQFVNEEGLVARFAEWLRRVERAEAERKAAND